MTDGNILDAIVHSSVVATADHIHVATIGKGNRIDWTCRLCGTTDLEADSPQHWTVDESGYSKQASKVNAKRQARLKAMGVVS